ncbi:MAG: hypothetical protein K1X83_05110 [Oligoflexia bacterium]|nr:hypothetical protein [Oligoflexia bacterium]
MDLFRALERAVSKFVEEAVQRPHPAAAPSADAERWDWPAFKGNLLHFARTLSYPAALPTRIDLDGLKIPIERLREQTAGGIEHGRMGYVNIYTGTLVLSRTVQGDQHSVRIPVERSIANVPVMGIHSHPRGLFQLDREDLHLSAQDYLSFLSTREEWVQIAVTGTSLIAAVKTSATPTRVDAQAVERRLNQLWEDAGRQTATPGRRVRLFSKLACIEYGLGLYIQIPEGPMALGQVRLTPKLD